MSGAFYSDKITTMSKYNALIFILIITTIFTGIFVLLNSQNKQDETLQNIQLENYSEETTNMQPNQSTSSDIIQDTMEQKKYQATLNTSAGKIVIHLNDTQTPKTVENFVTLAKKGFYNNSIFHRAIKGFMIQGGDPTGTGRGGPGYQFDDEPFTGDYTRGTVAMANAGPNTNGSQFFIMHADYNLPKNYVIFGKVTEGLDVVDAIATSPVTMSPPGENSKPVTPVKILDVAIVEL
jgi:cyclophilin family peptidyl-prolyl cis-trans isomerase